LRLPGEEPSAAKESRDRVIVEEVLVVLVRKEEVRITRVRTTDRHQEKVMLRHQEVVVT
jgi:hypothetical protein